MRADVIHSTQFRLCKRAVSYCSGKSHKTNKAHDRMCKNLEYGCLERLYSCEGVTESNKRCRPLCALHITWSASHSHWTAGWNKAEIFTLTLAVLLPYSRSCEKCAYVPWVFIFELLSVTMKFMCTVVFAVQLVTVNDQTNNLQDNWKIWERRCFYMGDLVVWQWLSWIKEGLCAAVKLKYMLIDHSKTHHLWCKECIDWHSLLFMVKRGDGFLSWCFIHVILSHNTMTSSTFW